MTFDYELENDEGEIVAVLEVEAWFSAYTPAYLDGAPEDCYPAEGGELEDLWVYEDGKDISGTVDEKYGSGTYESISERARELFSKR